MDQIQTENSPVLGRSVVSGRLSGDELREIRFAFAGRLREAFDGISNAEIARRLKTSDTAVKNYLDGTRLPITEMLIEITRVTGINLHWLITGTGPRRVTKAVEMFSEEEAAPIRELAVRSGRSFEDQVKVLAVAAVEMVGKV